jgi:DNA-binding response OmpR family regulator
MNQRNQSATTAQSGESSEGRPTVVVLTNYASPEFEIACRERGADYFFDKSTQFGALKVLLHSIQRERH